MKFLTVLSFVFAALISRGNSIFCKCLSEADFNLRGEVLRPQRSINYIFPAVVWRQSRTC